MPLIKRYPNRKLYNTEAKCYVTLDDVTEMIRDGEDIHVTDHETGDDLTTLTLTQIILEQEKKTTGFLPRSLLTSLIRTGGGTLEQLLRVRSLQNAMISSSERESEDDATDVDEDDQAVDAEGDDRSNSSSLAVVDERISDMLHLLNVPTHRDMRQLQEQLDLLGKQLNQLSISNQGEQESDSDSTSKDPVD